MSDVRDGDSVHDAYFCTGYSLPVIFPVTGLASTCECAAIPMLFTPMPIAEAAEHAVVQGSSLVTCCQ